MRRCMPFENSPTARVRIWLRPTISSNCSVRLSRSACPAGLKEVAEEIQGLARVEVAVEIRFLRQVTDARLGRYVPRRMAEDLDVALGRIQQAQQQLHGGGLAGAVGPEQAEHLAAAHLEVHGVHRARLGPVPEILEDLRQPAHGDDDFGVRVWI